MGRLRTYLVLVGELLNAGTDNRSRSSVPLFAGIICSSFAKIKVGFAKIKAGKRLLPILGTVPFVAWTPYYYTITLDALRFTFYV